MNANQLIKHFDRISEAPDSVPRLRQFILELAVRGKLVDRDRRDEPASMLLKQIQSEKDRRVRSGLMRKLEPLPPVSDDEAWFDIPPAWSWVRLGDITEVVMGQSPPGETYNKTGEGIPLINGPVEFTEGPFGRTVINQYTTAPTNVCEEGDLLLCVRGSTTGRTNIAAFKACIGRGVAAIRPFFADQYVRLFLWRIRESIIAMGRGIAFPSVSRKQIEELVVPLPPLAEQQRIVAKVDKLMALCDELESAKVDREKLRNTLLAASLHHLNKGADAKEFRKNAGFYLNHLPDLTARVDHIQRLKQTILNLAVRGKLVLQDQSDGSAGPILGNRQRILDIRSAPWELPPGWCWSSLALIGETLGGGTPSKADPEFWTGNIPWVSPKDMKMDVIADAQDHISEQALLNSAARLIPAGSLLLVVRGMILAHSFPTAKTVVPVTINQDMKAVVPFRPDLLEYLLLATKALKPEILKLVQRSTHGTCKLLTDDLFSMPIPIPPLFEQRRILAKSEQVMMILDRLETQIAKAGNESHRFLETVFHSALQSSNLPELATL